MLNEKMGRCKIVKKKNITIRGNRWIFKSDDPQIYIHLDRNIYGIELTFNVMQRNIESRVVQIYYRKKNEKYSAERVINIEVPNGKKDSIKVNFDFPVEGVRFDPDSSVGECEVSEFTVKGTNKEEFSDYAFQKENILIDAKNSRKVVIVTHDLSNTGAPILAYHIAGCLKRKDYDVVVVTGYRNNGNLEKAYQSQHIPIIEINKEIFIYYKIRENEKGEYIQETHNIVPEMLRKLGFSSLIANTIVAGNYIKGFKEQGFKIISLIHEMKVSIQLYDFLPHGNEVAQFADYIVFPNEIVKSDFVHIFHNISGKKEIHPQGVYLRENVAPEGVVSCTKTVDSDEKVIMSSGSCNLRKGVDLFLNLAPILIRKMPDKRLHFVWTGDFIDKELEGWVYGQIEKSNLPLKIDFIPFIDDKIEYRRLLCRADVFCAMSREDPFPSTVLEAMANNIPVVGFSGTGGIEMMLSDGRGYLVDNFDLGLFADNIVSLLSNQKKDLDVMLKKGCSYADSLKFDEYVDYLEKLL